MGYYYLNEGDLKETVPEPQEGDLWRNPDDAGACVLRYDGNEWRRVEDTRSDLTIGAINAEQINENCRISYSPLEINASSILGGSITTGHISPGTTLYVPPTEEDRLREVRSLYWLLQAQLVVLAIIVAILTYQM